MNEKDLHVQANSANWERLIAHLRKVDKRPVGGVGFDMKWVRTDVGFLNKTKYPHPCGSVACILGHAQVVGLIPDHVNEVPLARVLGLTFYSMTEIIYPANSAAYTMSAATAAMWLEIILNLSATRVVTRELVVSALEEALTAAG